MKKTIKIALYVAFGIYCLALINFFFINGRHYTENSVAYFFSRSNLIPFKTVVDYQQKMARNQINASTAIRNILGNLVVLFPLGCFLPCLWKPMQRFRYTILTSFGVVLLVELLQPTLCRGAFDIDDFILNLSGACLGFWIVHIPFVTRLLKRFFVYETGDVNKAAE